MIHLLLVFLLVAGPKQAVKDPNSFLRHEVGNLINDVAEAKARIESQESVIDAMRREMDNHLSTNKELIKGTLSESSGKMSHVEKVSQDLASDLVQLKKGVETALSQLEKKIEDQGKNLKHFETALKAVLDALGAEHSTPTLGADKAYIVKDGDSLGKIALAFGTTTKAIKEQNNLTKDTIRVGQKLQIP